MSESYRPKIGEVAVVATHKRGRGPYRHYQYEVGAVLLLDDTWELAVANYPNWWFTLRPATPEEEAAWRLSSR